MSHTAVNNKIIWEAMYFSLYIYSKFLQGFMFAPVATCLHYFLLTSRERNLLAFLLTGDRARHWYKCVPLQCVLSNPVKLRSNTAVLVDWVDPGVWEGVEEMQEEWKGRNYQSVWSPSHDFNQVKGRLLILQNVSFGDGFPPLNKF